jgi:hypothetical protein
VDGIEADRIIDFLGIVIRKELKEVLIAQGRSAAFVRFLTRPYAASVHKGTASASVAGLWFEGRACVARCQ